jgi:photosystem II stability/assembly factor-like uncharacterized protein
MRYALLLAGLALLVAGCKREQTTEPEAITPTVELSVEWQSPSTHGTEWSSVGKLAFVDSLSGWALGGGATILRTLDGGDNWTLQYRDTTATLTDLQFVDAHHGWAVGSGGTILHYDGASWQHQTSGATSYLTSVAFSDADHGWAVGGCCGMDRTVMLHTGDGGQTWTQQYDTLYCNQGIAAGGELCAWTLVGNGSMFHHTSDGGLTWSDQDPQVDDQLYGIAFPDCEHGWATSGQYVYRTVNGGLSWERLTGAIGFGPNRLWFLDVQHGWALNSAGAITGTMDGGDHWSAPFESGLWGLENICFADPNHGWVSGDGALVRTSDGGATWTELQRVVLDNLHGIAFPTATQGWAVGDYGVILHTTNRGSTWVRQTSGVGNGLKSVAFADVNHGWAVGSSSDAILKTENGGHTWTSTPFTGALNAVTCVDTGRAWAVGNLGLVMSYRNGAWSSQSIGTDWWLTAVDFVDELHGWAVGDSGQGTGSHVGGVVHTSDGGQSWTAENIGSAPQLFGVDFLDENEGWVVGTGVILHYDHGTWSRQTPANRDFTWAVRFSSHLNGWTVGESLGVSVVSHTTDGGRTWMRGICGAGLPSSLGALAVADGDHIYSCGTGGAIIKCSQR